MILVLEGMCLQIITNLPVNVIYVINKNSIKQTQGFRKLKKIQGGVETNPLRKTRYRKWFKRTRVNVSSNLNVYPFARMQHINNTEM